ncbi:MAG: YadA-like family protein [Fusobacterium necrophorum]|nr:YadA-like family protein [Fusobacterium necrophorum]
MVSNKKAIIREIEDRKAADAELDKKVKTAQETADLNKRANDVQSKQIAGLQFADIKHERAILENKSAITKEVEARKEVDERHDKAIAANSSAIKHLDRKVNKGTSMLVAMSNVDFQDVNAGEVAVGAGVGHYVGDQAVAVGVAYGVNDDLKIHAKWSGVAGDPHYNAIGGGVTYKFRTR